MRPRHRSLRSICIITSCLAAAAFAGCGTSESAGGGGGKGGATSPGSAGSTGGDATAGSGGPGDAGTVGTAGTSGGAGGGGTDGTAGKAGTTGGAAGDGGASGSGTGGSSGAVGSGGRGGGGTAGAAGRGGSGGGTAGAGTAGGGTAGAGTAGRGGGTAGSGSGGATGSGGLTGSGGIGTMTIPGMGCTPPATYNNLFVSVSGHTQADTDAKISAAWTKLFTAGGSGAIYFNGPGTDESYVEDIFNGDVRTEGMSYGMMIAVQLDHQTEFDRLWTFVKNHMAQGTGEIAWHVSTSGSKLATGGAPDGEEYMATALIFAAKRWGNTSGKFNYATEAQWVLNVIRTLYFNASAHLVQFVRNSGNTDGSYVLPAFYQTWACFDAANADFWNASVTAARTFFHNAIDANGVIGDRSSFTGQTQQGAGSDAIRCVMNIMMDHNFFDADPWQTDTYATKYGAYETTRASGVAQQSCNALLGFGLPASTGKAFVDKLWSTTVPNRDYWNGVLYMLGLLHVSGQFHLYY